MAHSKKVSELPIGGRFTVTEDQNGGVITSSMRVYTVEKNLHDPNLVMAKDNKGWHTCFEPDNVVFPWDWGKEL
jgi:hypothetical protein